MDKKDKDNLDKNNLLKAYKYRLYPTKTQVELMDKYFTASREFYNTALEDRTVKFYNALTGESVTTYEKIDEKCKKLLVDKICSEGKNKKEIAQEFFELSNDDQIKDKEAIKKQTQDGKLYINLYEKLDDEDQRKMIGLVLRILYSPDNNPSQSGENCVPKVVENLEKLISMKTVEQEFYVYYKNLNPEYQGLNADYKEALSNSGNKEKIARELIELFLKKRMRENPNEQDNIKEEIRKKYPGIKDIKKQVEKHKKELIEKQVENETLYTDLDKDDQNKIRRLWLKLLYEPYLKLNKLLGRDLRDEILKESKENLEGLINIIYSILNEEHKAALIRELIRNKAEEIIHSELGTSLKKKQKKEAINNLLGEINDKLLNESGYTTIDGLIENYKKDEENKGELYLDKVDKAMLDSVYDDLNTVFANFCEGKFSKKVDPKKGRSSKGTAEYPHRRVENINSFTYSDEDKVKQCKVVFGENRLYHPLFPKANHNSIGDSKGGIRCIVHRPYDKSKKIVLEKCTISRKLSGKYYVVMVIDHGAVIKFPKEIHNIKKDDIIGIDIGERELGLSTRKLCIYPEGKIKNPEETDQGYSDKKTKKTYNNKAEKRYGVLEKKNIKYKKELEAKTPNSNAWKEARKKLATLNEHITNKKKDYWHHQSINLVLEDSNKRFNKCREIDWSLKDEFKVNKDGIGIGRVNLGNPSKDWRKHQLGKFKEFLEYKARWYGIHYDEVNEKNTTNICSVCKEKYTDNEFKKLTQRKWKCDCGREHVKGDVVAKFNCGKEYIHDEFRKIERQKWECRGCQTENDDSNILNSRDKLCSKCGENRYDNSERYKKWECDCGRGHEKKDITVKFNCGKEYTYDEFREREQRRWTCKKCNTEHDRDENAAKNIARITLEEMKKEPSKTKEDADKLRKGKGGHRGKGGRNNEHHKRNKGSQFAQKKHGGNQKHKGNPNNHYSRSRGLGTLGNIAKIDKKS